MRATTCAISYARALISFAILSMVLMSCTKVIPAIAPGVKFESDISAAFPFSSEYVEVLSSKMHYVETGAGRPILFLHGNPTSSYLWRNILPHASTHGRAIAVDLIGMGKSGKPDIDYALRDHIQYVDAFIEALNLSDVTLVLHGPGGAIGIDYAMRHPENVRDIVFMEALVKPLSLSERDPVTQFIFRRMRDQIRGPELVIRDNYFVEKLIKMFAGRKLSAKELAAYREPFLQEEHRQPILAWVNEVPFDGRPQHSFERVSENYRKLQASDVPLHLIYARPGGVINAKVRRELLSDLPRMTSVGIGQGLHYIQETSPQAIGTALGDWLSQTK